MRNFKYAIDQIVRKPITFFMIIIQIVFSSTLLLQTISTFCEANYTYKMTKNILENKNLYSMSIGFESNNKIMIFQLKEERILFRKIYCIK